MIQEMEIQKEFKTFGEYLYWTYANTNMYMYVFKNELNVLNQTAYSIRAKAFKAYKESRWSIHSLYENNNWKMDWGKSRCWYCGKPVSECGNLSVEHILPRSKGGDNNFDNIAYACKSCNSSKGNKDLIEWFVEDCNELPSVPMICMYLKLIYKYALENNLMNISLNELKNLNIPFSPNSVVNLPNVLYNLVDYNRKVQ